MAKISVIIPTYNRGYTILRAVESVLNQTCSDLEVLVIDDGSVDGTAGILGRIRDDRLQYIALESNKGVANARNVGAGLAKGEWIAFQDSDDSWRENKLEKQMAYADAHPEYAMIYGMYLAKLQDGRQILSPTEPWPEIMEGNMLNTLLVRNVIGAPTMCIRREAFMESGGFDITYRSLEDWEYAIRFARRHSIGFVPEVLMDVYMQPDGISSKAGSYFESRCRMLSAFRTELLQEGLFDAVVMDILNRAKSAGVLEGVQKMIMLSLR